MSEAPTAKLRQESESSPVLRLVTHLLKTEHESGNPIKPKIWIMELLGGLRDQLKSAGIEFEGYRGPAGCAFLRDPMAGSSADQRPITRFHAARGFIEEAIERASKRLDEQPEDEQLQQRSAMRRRLFDWVVEAEELYEQQHAPGGATKPRARKSRTRSAAREQRSAVPLSFFNESQRTEVQGQLLDSFIRITGEEGIKTVLRELEQQLSRVEPEVVELCQRTLAPATTFDGAMCSVFAIMSETGTSSFQRAWLSELGSFMVELKGELLAVVAKASSTAPADESEAEIEPEIKPVPEPAAVPVAKSSPRPKPAPASKARPEDQPVPAAKPQRTEPGQPASAESPAARGKPGVKPPATEKIIATAPARKPAAQAGLTPTLRREIKLAMVDAFGQWEDPDAVWNERKCLAHLCEKLVDLDPRLIDSIKESQFVAARENVEAIQADNAGDQKLKRQATMLLQDVQTAYMQRLREMMDLAIFVDPDQRRTALKELVQFWKSSFDKAEGKAATRTEMADAKTLAELAQRLGGLPAGCQQYLDAQLEKAEGIESLWMRLIQQEAGDPMTTLFRSQLKGFTEDIDLLRAFGQTERDGWLTLINILSRARPITESELVAMLARKVDALGRTLAHENFLNPTRNLRLTNFLAWVTNGYVLSPSFSDTPEEKAAIAHLAWILEELAGLVMLGEDQSSLDAFLADEVNGQYAVYATYLSEVARRFEAWFSEWKSANP